MNGPNKLVCYITLASTGLPGPKTLAYWALPAKIRLGRKGMPGRSGLLQKFVNYGLKSFYNIIPRDPLKVKNTND
jgi:hypothetical protein